MPSMMRSHNLSVVMARPTLWYGFCAVRAELPRGSMRKNRVFFDLNALAPSRLPNWMCLTSHRPCTNEMSIKTADQRDAQSRERGDAT